MRVAVDGFYSEVENVAAKGLDDVQFCRPLLPGTVISVSSTILETAEASNPAHGQLRSEWLVTDEADEIILSLEIIEVFERREPLDA